MTEDTNNPPVWHIAGDAHDPLSVAFAGGVDHYVTVNGGAAPWGILRYAKIGWWAYVKGGITIPASGAQFITLPPAYKPVPGQNEVLDAWLTGFGVDGSPFQATALGLFDSGALARFDPPAMPAGANSLFLSCKWITAVYGE